MTPAIILAMIAALIDAIDQCAKFANSPSGQALAEEFARDIAAEREFLMILYSKHQALASAQPPHIAKEEDNDG